MKVYIAAPFFSESQLETVKKIETLLTDYDIEFFSPRSEGTLKDMAPDERKAAMSGIFESNIKHMDWCTHSIAVIDDYDTGTIWEMGYMFHAGKEIVTYSDMYHGINVMLNESISYHATNISMLVDGLLGNVASEKTGDVF